MLNNFNLFSYSPVIRMVSQVSLISCITGIGAKFIDVKLKLKLIALSNTVLINVVPDALLARLVNVLPPPHTLILKNQLLYFFSCIILGTFY